MKFPARGVLLDVRRGGAIDEEGAEGIAVVSRVGEQRLGFRHLLDQPRGRRQIVAVTFRQGECEEPSETIDEGVNLGGTSTPASPDRLELGPPFPPAPQR